MQNDQNSGNPLPFGILEKLAEQISQLSRQNPDSSDLKRNIHQLLQGQLRHLDLVSRAEFEAQVTVLQRSREKIDKLEQELAALTESTTGG